MNRIGRAVAAGIVSSIMAAIPAAAQNPPGPAPPVLQIGAAVGAVIEKIYVQDDDHVERGQPLIKFDCRPLEAEVRVRQANAEAARAAFERTRNGPRPDEIAIGEASVGVAKARAEEADAAFARANSLREGVTITVALVLQAQRDARISAAQLIDARKKLDLLRAGSRIEDIEEARARFESASAGADEAKAQWDQCTVHAPAAGTVKVLATIGQFVSTNVPVTLARITIAGPKP